ncbi:DNA cytosine methyltransferase [Streptomyces parvus]|uniref:DNA cytosine methyltransferase n=1 Tax=Streptomyces parvus TaxID=66428 RepID=UPI0033D9ECDA
MARTSVELFAGGGGLVQAARQAGFRPLLMNEFAKRACETLEQNKGALVPEGERPRIPNEGDPTPLVAGDVRKLEMEYLEGKVDLLAGGPPCQPFSLGGIAKGDEDKRNMFPEMFRAVREIKPKAVLCENVRGLLRPSFKPYFQYILRELELPFVERTEGTTWQEHDALLRSVMASDEVPAEQRYDVIVTEVNAANYGVPQIRHRVIIVAFRADLGVDRDVFKRSIQETHSEEALQQSMLDGSYWARHPEVTEDVKKRAMASFSSRPPLPATGDTRKQPWRTLRDAIKGIQPGEGPLPKVPLDELDKKKPQGGVPDHVGWPGARIYSGHTPNMLDRPAKTVKAGVHGVPGGESVMLLDQSVPDENEQEGRRYLHRYMTVRETARVMTFRDDWTLCGPRGEKMRQLGNAVPVLLGEVFAKAAGEALDAAEKGK